MKRIFFITGILPVLLFTACENENVMHTTIYPDGSCVRSFTEKVDSAFIMGDTSNNNLPVLIDSSWKITWFYDSSKIYNTWPVKEWPLDTIVMKKRDFTFIASLKFPSVDKMNQQYWFNNSSWDTLATFVSLKKSFRWFYTWYDFYETYPRLGILQKIPIENYLTHEEAKMWFQGYDNNYKGLNGIELNDKLNGLEKKVEQWLSRSFFEEYYQIILDNYSLIPDRQISPDDLMEKKQKVYEAHLKQEEFLDFDIAIMDSIFETDAFSELIEKHPDINRRFEDPVDFTDYFEQNLEYRLQIPGEIIESNARELRGDTLIWLIDAYRFALYDYTIHAKSRKQNLWVTIASLVFVILTILALFRRKRQTLL